MARPRSDAPDRLVAVTAQLVRERGVHATGLKDIARAAGVPMGSLYFHFPDGKQQLVLAALASSGDVVTAVVADTFARATDVRAAVRGFIELMAASLEQSGFTQGCPIATAGLELGADADDAAAVIDRAFTAWAAVVEEHLRAAGHGDAGRLATLVVAALEGGLVLSRVKRSAAPLRDVADALDELLARAG